MGITTVLLYVDLAMAFMGCLYILSRFGYDMYLSWVASIIIVAGYIGSLYTCSLLLSWNFEIVLTIQLLFSVFFALVMRSCFDFRRKTVQIDYRVLAICWVASIVFMIFSERWGGWDAWSIWILHAKFMYYPDKWTSMFDPNMAWSHPDYPLLLPATIAAFWQSLGGVFAFVPASIALLNFLMLLVLLLSRFRKYIYICLGLFLLLILDFNFVKICASQYADSLLALIYLIVIILFVERPKLYMLIIGVMCSIALSIKNEGYVFLIAVIFYSLIYENDKLSKYKNLFVGLLPLALIALYFKIAFAPTNDLISGQTTSILDKILSPDRYFQIIRFALETLITKYYTLLIIIVLCYKNMGFLPKEYRILLFTFVAYLCIYLVTPRELLWHMSTSMKRLFHHLYPAILFLILHVSDLTILNERLKRRFT